MKKKNEKAGKNSAVVSAAAPLVVEADLLGDIRGLIEASREQFAQAVNSGLVLLYWAVGERIGREILGNQRAEYGKEILQTVSEKLVTDYGQGFSPRNLARMIGLATRFSDCEIVSQLARRLGWSHFVEILPIDKPF